MYKVYHINTYTSIQFHYIYTRYKEKHNELKNNTDFLKIDIELNETESEIVALRKYYNDIITDYNKLAKTFPTNIIRIMCKYKKQIDYYMPE